LTKSVDFDWSDARLFATVLIIDALLNRCFPPMWRAKRAIRNNKVANPGLAGI
jgi:hypothetical protein